MTVRRGGARPGARGECGAQTSSETLRRVEPSEEIRRVVHRWLVADFLEKPANALIARIVCCCDAYNAMTTTRSYRSAMTPEAALQEVRAHSGTQFDPAVVEALMRIEEPAQTASSAA